MLVAVECSKPLRQIWRLPARSGTLRPGTCANAAIGVCTDGLQAWWLGAITWLCAAVACVPEIIYCSSSPSLPRLVPTIPFSRITRCVKCQTHRSNAVDRKVGWGWVWQPYQALPAQLEVVAAYVRRCIGGTAHSPARSPRPSQIHNVCGATNSEQTLRRRRPTIKPFVNVDTQPKPFVNVDTQPKPFENVDTQPKPFENVDTQPDTIELTARPKKRLRLDGGPSNKRQFKRCKRPHRMCATPAQETKQTCTRACGMRS